MADRYRIGNLIGRGGMGEVYYADDLKLGQIVALKFLPQEVENDPSVLAQFVEEVKIARQVTHINVCRVFDIGETSGLHFISMEHIKGEDLSLLLRRLGRLPQEKALEISRQLCAGLAAVHDRGILHRDLKPSNVMLDDEGQVRLTDFGLAASVGTARRGGTPAYLAPELWDGQRGSVQSDIYALGLVLYEVFTGKRTFRARSYDEMARMHAEEPPVPPSKHMSGIDPQVEKLILQCLDKEPDRRPASAQAVADNLPTVPSSEVMAQPILESSSSRMAGNRVGEHINSFPWPVIVTGPMLLGPFVGGICYWQWNLGALFSVLAGFGSAILTLCVWLLRERIEGRWSKSIADGFEANVRLYGSLIFSGFRRRYYKQLCYRHRVFNVRGLRTRGIFSLELEKVFVDLKVAPQSIEAVSPDLLQRENLTRHSSIWELLVSVHSAFRSLAVIGAPGSGKTTLLQHLAVIFSQNQQRRHEKRCRAYVPILLFLRDHADAVTAKEPPTLAQLLFEAETREGLKPPAQWFERKLEAGKTLVLLDGLDEVGDARKRKQVAVWVAKQIQRYGGSRFIVTSRPRGYQTNPLPEATVLEVQPFNLQQVERFVESWYLANEILSFGKDDAGVRQKAKKHGQDLLQRLRNAPSLAALVINPLLLTMIAMVHRYRGALPGRRVELYAEICDVLLGHWQAAKGLATELTAAQQRMILEPMALHLMDVRNREISAAEAEAIVSEPLARLKGSTATASAFLQGVQSGSGLLLERESGVYSFAHLTFQEYLAAAHLVKNRDPARLVAHIDDSWWHEVIRLYSAQSDGSPIVKACLEAARPSTLSLAYACSQEGMLEADVAEELEGVLIGGLEAPEPKRRALAAEVMLELRLRDLLRLNDSVEIDTSYISCAEYQLFIDEKRAAGEYRRPDHWRNQRFAEGTADNPIAGVRYADAIEFCEWLTERAPRPGWRVRLPTPKEVRENPIPVAGTGDRFDSLRVDSVGSWVAGDSPQLVGLSDKQQRRVRAAEVSAFDRAIDRALERDEARALDSALDSAIARARDRVLVLNLDLDYALALARALERDFDRVFSFDRGPIDRATDSALALARDLDLAAARAIDRAIGRALARDRGIVRTIARAFNRHYILDRDLDRALNSYTDLALIVSRIEGNLPAWEGIRIVRERRLINS